MSFTDGLVGFGNALPGVAGQVINTYHAQTQLDRQKKADQDKQDDLVLKTLEQAQGDPSDPESVKHAANLRSLAVIGRMRQAQPDYKPGKKGLVNDLFSIPIEQHPEWAQLHQSVKMLEALQGADSGGGGGAAAAGAGMPPEMPPPRATMDSQITDQNMGGALPAGLPGAGPSPDAALGTGPGAGGGVPAMPGASLSMPQGSMMTPDNPSSPSIPPPGPSAPGPIPGAAPVAAPPPPVPPAGAGPVPGPPPAGPTTGVHPELEAMLRDAGSRSAVGDVAAADTEAGKAYGRDVLGGMGARGEAAFKAGAGDRITQRDTLRTRASQANAADKEAAAWKRQTQAADDAMKRVGARSDAAMTRLKEAETLHRQRPVKGRQAPVINTEKELVDIHRDALKDISEVEKEVDRQLTTARLDAQKNFTNPSQAAALEDQIRRMGEDRKKTITSNRDSALEFLKTMGGGGARAGAGAGANPKPMIQHSASTGAYRYSLDGGKTFIAGKPPGQ